MALRVATLRQRTALSDVNPDEKNAALFVLVCTGSESSSKTYREYLGRVPLFTVGTENF